MYGWLWRSLPEPWWLRATLLVVLAATVLVILFLWAFPAIAPHMPFNDNTLQ